MALNVIGESGVRIRPVTSGFVPELQAYIDSTSGRVGVDVPLSIGSAQLEAAIAGLKSSAAGGAVLPIELARKGVDAGLSEIRKTAEAGADFALRAQDGALEQTISDAKSTAERGATMPLDASDVDLQASIADARANAEVGADMPLFPGESAVEAALGMLRGSAEAGASFPIVLDADQAIGELARFQNAVRGSSASLPLDTSSVVSGLDNAQNSAAQFGDQFGGVIDRLNGQISGLGVGVGGLGSKLTGLLSSPGGALIGGGAIAGAFAGANVLSAGNQRLTRIEDSTAALEIQLGGAKQAAALVADILETVNGTPFTLDQFVEAGRTLVTFGTAAEKIPTYLTAIGEAAAGSGQGIEAVGTITDVFAKMQIAGRATTDDWQRLGFVGVNALKIWGNAAGKTTAEMQELVTDGALPAGEAIDQLIAGITNGSSGVAGKVNKLGGSMEKLRGTFSGAAGGLQAASARLGVAFLEPFRPTTVALIQTATKALDALGPVVRNVLTGFTSSAGVQAFIGTVEQIPEVFDRISGALKRGGITGAIDEIISLTGPLRGTLESIFDNITSNIEPLGRVLSVVVSGIRDAVTILGGGFFLALRGAVQVLEGLVTAADQARPFVRALASALAALFILKKFELFNSLFLKLNGITSASAAAARANAVAQTEDAAATNANAASKGRLSAATIAATQAQVASTAAATASAERQFLLANNSGLGAGAPLAANTRRELQQLESSLVRQRSLAGRVGTELSGGITRAKTSITNFANAFRAELALAVGFVAFMVTTNLLKERQASGEADGARTARQSPEGVRGKDVTDNLRRNNKGIAEAVKTGDANYRQYLDGQLGLLQGMSEQANLLAEQNSGLGGFARQFVGQLDNLAPDGTTNEWTQRMAEATGRQEELRLSSKALTEEFVKQTRGWGTLATAIRTTGSDIENLGAKRLTDPNEVAANTEAVRKRLEKSKTEANRLAGRDTTPAELAAISKQAAILGQYDLPTLEAALEAAGLDLETVDLNSEEFATAISEAAKATAGAQAEAVGLSRGLGEVAAAYAAAKESGAAFAGIINTQGRAWLDSLTSQDAFAESLRAIQYESDLTASNLAAVEQAFEASVGDAYTQKLFEAGDASNALSQATEAAAGRSTQLREEFIQNQIEIGNTRAEAEVLATGLLGIPNKIRIDIAIAVAQEQLDAAVAKMGILKEQAAAGTGFGSAWINGFQIPLQQGVINNAQTNLDSVNRMMEEANRQQAAAQQASADQIRSTREQEAAQQAREDAKRAAEEAAREAKRLAEEAAREAERRAEEEKRRREKELQDFLQTVQGIRKASEQMKGSFEKLIDTFRQKRQELIGDITKRVEFDPATSVTRLIRNADQRNKTLAESQKGLTDLRQRGLSEDAIKSIGLTGQAEDARAIRRLLKASPAELKALSASVGKLGETATQAAYREQGQVIGREIRDVLEAWVETPGVRNPNVSVETILKLIRDSKGDSELAASRIAKQLGGVVKR